jgi:hypothetical protein
VWIVLGTIAIVLGTVGIGVVLDRKLRIVPRKERLLEAGGRRPELPPHEPGEAAASAIRATPGEVERMRRQQRCPACRAALDVIADDRVRYDGRELLVLAFTCPRCSTRKRIYVDPAR